MISPNTRYFITARFSPVVEWLLPHETVFAPGHYGDYNFAVPECVPGDRGGLTKFGIDQRSHPSVNIRELTFDQAVMIYLHDYWLPCRAEEFPPGYGEVIFDIRVNGGNGPRLLQEAMASVGCYIGAADGIIGPKTKAAMAQAGTGGLKEFLLKRRERYINLAENDPSDAQFLDGWLNRNHDLAKFVGITL